MLLFFDTETTGLPKNYKAPASDVQNWPRMVQIAWMLVDEQENEIESAEYIVRPDGFTIPPEAARVHNITTEMALRDGVALSNILPAIESCIERASALVAHNISFDEKILGAEFVRAKYPNALETRPRKCTMASATDFCRLPGRYGYKWPTLMELYTKLFQRSFSSAHNALVDVRACKQCYFELKRLKIMT